MSDQFVVVRDGWIPEKYFDDISEAWAYLDYCRRHYKGSYSLKRCDAEHPRRFMDAIIPHLPEVVIDE